MFYRKTRKQLDERVASAKHEVEVSRQPGTYRETVSDGCEIIVSWDPEELKRAAQDRRDYAVYFLDDDPEVPYRIAFQGYQIAAANNLASAMEKIQEHRIDRTRKSWYQGELVYSEPCDAH